MAESGHCRRAASRRVLRPARNAQTAGRRGIRRHNVPIAVATDWQPRHLAHAIPAHDDVDGRDAVRASRRRRGTLAGVTRNAARALGLHDDIGTLEAGKCTAISRSGTVERRPQLVYRNGIQRRCTARIWRGTDMSVAYDHDGPAARCSDHGRPDGHRRRRRCQARSRLSGPSVEAAAQIVADAASGNGAGLRRQHRLRQARLASASRRPTPRRCSAISSCRTAAASARRLRSGSCG